MRYVHIYWNQLLPDLNMDPFSGMFHVLLLCSHFLFVNVCYVTYTQQPTAGHRCVASLNTELTLWHTDRPQCVWRCLKLKTCRYINYNYETRQCDLGPDKCESLVPAVGVAVSVFGPPRDTCVHWGSRHEHGRVVVELQFPNNIRYLARIAKDDNVLVGKFNPKFGNFYGNNGGERVGPVLETDQDIEFLTMDPTCTLTWMPYTAGGLLPFGVVSGGLLADGSTTYVSKVTHDNVRLSFGYYNTKTELVYYDVAGARTKTSMELLVLV